MIYSEFKSIIEKFRPHILPLSILLVAALAVYGRVVGHEFLLNWDDSYYVVANDAVHGFSWDHIQTVFSTYYVGNYAPVQMLSYMLDYQIWGLWAGGFLITNLFIHFLNGILAYRLFIRFHGERFFSMIATAVFLLHPLQVESVAWISQRKNLLAMLFFLIAWECYCCYRDAVTGKRTNFYILSLLSFVMALLSKSVVVIFPMVLLLYDLCFLQDRRKLLLLDKIPYFLAAFLTVYLALQSQLPDDSAFWGGGGGRMIEYHGGSPLATFYTMLPVFCRYLGILLWPVNLSAEYTPLIHYSMDITVVFAFLLLSVLLLSVFGLFFINRKLGFWGIFFILGLLPVSQIVPLVTLMNDRYLYFPMLGAAALIAKGLAYLRDRASARYKVVYLSISVMLLVVMSIVSFRQVAVWRNVVTLWSNATAVSPNSYMVWERLGESYHFSSATMKTEALKAYNRALELNPVSDITLYNVGILYTGTGEYAKGRNAIIKLLERNPDHVMGLVALGDNYQKSGEFVDAEKAYLNAYNIQPEAPQIFISLGELAIARGLFHSAKEYYQQAEKRSGNNPSVAYHLAILESMEKNETEALMWLEKAFQRGWKDCDAILSENNFKFIRETPEFKKLLRGCYR